MLPQRTVVALSEQLHDKVGMQAASGYLGDSYAPSGVALRTVASHRTGLDNVWYAAAIGDSLAVVHRFVGVPLFHVRHGIDVRRLFTVFVVDLLFADLYGVDRSALVIAAPVHRSESAVANLLQQKVFVKALYSVHERGKAQKGEAHDNNTLEMTVHDVTAPPDETTMRLKGLPKPISAMSARGSPIALAAL